MAAADGQKTCPRHFKRSCRGGAADLRRNEIFSLCNVPGSRADDADQEYSRPIRFSRHSPRREEERSESSPGAWMGGMRGAVVMQTAASATWQNVLASLRFPSGFNDHVRVLNAELRRIQLPASRWFAAPCGRCSLSCDGASHRTRLRGVRIHRRSIDQEPSPRRRQVALIMRRCDRRKKAFEEMKIRMSTATRNHCRHTKGMNGSTSPRGGRRRKNEEAVVGGIGNTNFDSGQDGHPPRRSIHVGKMGLAFTHCALGVADGASRRDAFSRSEGDGSLLCNWVACRPSRVCRRKIHHVVRDIMAFLPGSPASNRDPAPTVAECCRLQKGCGITKSQRAGRPGRGFRGVWHRFAVSFGADL